MPQEHNTPSLYEMLTGHFTGGLSLNLVSEENQVILSVLDNMQRILNCRAGTLPVPLAPEKRDMLRRQAPLPQAVITQTQQQLARLDKLPPDWNIVYSRQLIEQARVLWPEQAKSMALHWQQQLNAAALPTERLNGWYQGMMRLQKLSDRLNVLDEQKGKYMTVSELKSAVFSTMQSFNQSIPAEEQLRILSENPAGVPLPAAARAQLEMHLKQLTARYAAIKQTASE
ncbi:type VI secretion system protein VasL [Kosakonia arachidis]|uniref:Type VI secretion system protein VasL n=1 Tax=Kosakonia arachidis TaxID=551989 RepID=A0A1I7C203_9ENTR|nr:type VI secretion system protein VasL [Kosakonia arachidis]